MTYKTIRIYARRNPKVLRCGLTLQQAQEHCENPETDSRTCKKPWNKRRIKKFGDWFDTHIEETNNPEPTHSYFQ